MKKRKMVSVLTVLFSTFLLGCPSQQTGTSYTRDQVRKSQTIQTGTVLRVDPVQIEGTKSGVGTVSGGAVGGAVGSSIGRGSGSCIAGAIGAVAGGLAGSAVEEAATKRDGLQITVELKGGRTIAVVQEADVVFQPGDQVQVLTGPDGTTRVTY